MEALGSYVKSHTSHTHTYNGKSNVKMGRFINSATQAGEGYMTIRQGRKIHVDDNVSPWLYPIRYTM